jgi:decaprenylphospho-beta-D-erythro-pentofuranosid-2-ulose 2-reductase
MKRVLIIGATSAIAEATARIFAERGAALHLLARNPERLDTVASDLKLRGAAEVTQGLFDGGDIDAQGPALAAAYEALGLPDIVLIAYGDLPDQKACEADAGRALEALTLNGTSVIALLTRLAGPMEERGEGTLAVISSVAGDRGRQSNAYYGAAKGMVSIFLSGLRNRLHDKGVQVITVKPGFVDTPMTAAFDKGPLWASPDSIAKGIVKAIDKRKDVVYLPWFWRWIMLVIRLIPEPLFKRLKL